MRTSLLTLLISLLFACDAQPPAQSLDSGVSPVMPVDAGAETDGGADAGDTAFTECTGACRETTLIASLGAKTAPFERVQFGFTSPAQSSAGEWELYVEAHAGGASACPDQSSPSPDRTIVISGVALPEEGIRQTRDGGLSTVLLDFSGELTDEPFVRAQAVTLMPSAANLCPGCVQDGGSPQAQVFAFELDAELPDGGAITGHGFAEHCPSMDVL